MIRLQIIGALGSDAEVRQLDNGRSAISFSVAHSEKWKDQSGQQQERTTWVRCTIWRKSDQVAIAQYLTKGTKVLAEGEPSARAYLSSTGAPTGSLELNVKNIELLGGGTRTQGQAQPTQQKQSRPAVQTVSSGTNAFASGAGAFDDESDLPF